MGDETYFVPAIVISEIVWVLGSSYERKYTEIADYVKTLLSVRNIKIVYEYDVRKSVSLYESLNIKYNDCVIASMMDVGDMVISFDHDFNRLVDIKRVEPEDLIG
jgi:predicted nucleic-acid-binding protein